MDFNLTSGVDLHIIPTKQFKMNHVLINFTTPQTQTNATARNLLANLLETSTHRYPTQTALARELAKLYGAYVGMRVSRIGRLHTVRLKATFVNDHFATSNLFQQVVGLINEILFHPLVDDHEFDGPTFRLQSNNLRSSLATLTDDKQFYANQQLMQLCYAPDSVMRIPSFGRMADLDQLTPQNLVRTYQQMINQDKVDIFVLGDVDPQTTHDLLAQLPFTPRQIELGDPFAKQALAPAGKQQNEYQEVRQAKLNLAYRFPVYYRDDNYFAAMVFNGMFGGTPYSKLFTNVREKASLAYYATSRMLPFSGLLTIQTGIKASDKDKVINLITKQLADLQAGRFTDQQLTEVQNSLINQYLSGDDLANNILARELICAVLGLPQEQAVTTKIKQVNTEDIMRVANLLKEQAVYLLSGEK